MHAVEILSGIVGLLLGCLLGMWLVKRKQPNIDALKAEHKAYRGDVEKHFEQTAELAHQMAEDYRRMYQHLAQGAVALCEPEDSVATPSLLALQQHVRDDEAAAGSNSNKLAAEDSTAPSEQPEAPKIKPV